jgi:hypothetical protein
MLFTANCHDNAVFDLIPSKRSTGVLLSLALRRQPLGNQLETARRDWGLLDRQEFAIFSQMYVCAVATWIFQDFTLQYLCNA